MDGVQKATESLREFAERMSFALTHCRIPDDIAMKQFMLGCRDKAEISYLKNGEVPPATIRDCITSLHKRDINVDSKPNGLDPRSVSHGGSRSVRGRSPSRTDTDETLESRIMNKTPQVVAMTLQQSRLDPPPQTLNTIPNGSPHQTIPPPKIRSDADQKIQDSDQYSDPKWNQRVSRRIIPATLNGEETDHTSGVSQRVIPARLNGEETDHTGGVGRRFIPATPSDRPYLGEDYLKDDEVFGNGSLDEATAHSALPPSN
ncbi:unnamed protein product [Aphanomyces euteiches]